MVLLTLPVSMIFNVEALCATFHILQFKLHPIPLSYLDPYTHSDHHTEFHNLSPITPLGTSLSKFQAHTFIVISKFTIRVIFLPIISKLAPFSNFRTPKSTHCLNSSKFSTFRTPCNRYFKHRRIVNTQRSYSEPNKKPIIPVISLSLPLFL